MTFPNPPIVEAIFHLVVERASDLDDLALNDYAKYIAHNFPIFDRQEKRYLTSNISFNLSELDNINTSISDDLAGYILHSHDNSKAIQANINDFSFSKLRPYETWESFYKEANEFWRKYIEIASVNRVKRLSLRYLNHIPIPFENRPIKLHDYIKICPDVSDDLSMTTSGYFMQIALDSLIYKPSKAIVNQTIDNSNSDLNFIHLIFDIEVFQDVDLDHKDSSIESIFIENLRQFKNDVFLNSITEKTRELFT